ncbi:H-NS family histone-like protein [Enterovibrio calviensis]|uniref:H-NS family histone-like protein n=1 Tax=Enterovibrio calviensis TaxID=91359 RepID=UPI000481E72D|nr:hypothetical protein [Enterovibrio calviensis]
MSSCLNFAKTTLRADADIDVESFVLTLQKNLDRMQHNPDTVQWSEVMTQLSKVQTRRIIAASKRMDCDSIYMLKDVIDAMWEVNRDRVTAHQEHNRKLKSYIEMLKADGVTPQDFGFDGSAKYKIIIIG